MEQKHMVAEKYAGKFVTPQEMLNLLKKNETNRIWILKQLSQLGIDTKILEDYSLNELHKQCDKIIRSTYSIKYLGMNQNEMGIISRRVDPFKQSNFNLNELPKSSYTVNKFFLSKPLKVGRKIHKEEKLNIDNLEEQIKTVFDRCEKKEHKFNSKNKKLIKGSWINSARVQNQSRKENSNLKQETLELPEQCLPEHAMGKSYSRFLSNGMLLLRDTTS